jgi:hypothetical protein
VVVRGVTVEKLGFSEKSRKSGDRKCPGDWEKSFVELPDAKQFVRILDERVFQQPQDLSTSLTKSASSRVFSVFFISFAHTSAAVQSRCFL